MHPFDACAVLVSFKLTLQSNRPAQARTVADPHAQPPSGFVHRWRRQIKLSFQGELVDSAYSTVETRGAVAAVEPERELLHAARGLLSRLGANVELHDLAVVGDAAATSEWRPLAAFAPRHTELKLIRLRQAPRAQITVADDAIGDMDREVTGLQCAAALAVALLSGAWRLFIQDAIIIEWRAVLLRRRLQCRARETSRIDIAHDLGNAHLPRSIILRLQPLAATVLTDDQIELRATQRDAIRTHAPPEQRPQLRFYFDRLDTKHGRTTFLGGGHHDIAEFYRW